MASKDNCFPSISKIFILWILCISMSPVGAQKTLKSVVSFDHIVKHSLSGYSGIPYVALIEYNYKISGRLELGVLTGMTPQVFGAGIRIKSVLWEDQRAHSIFIRSHLIYYPSTRDLGGDPWVLVWPILNYGYQWNKTSFVWFSTGCVGAAKVKDSRHSNVSIPSDYTQADTYRLRSDLWFTLGVGYKHLISDKFQIHLELNPIFKGTQLASSSNWVGGPPVIGSFGWTYMW